MAAITPALANTPRTFNSFSEIASFLWSVADLLRGDYKQADYGNVILPFTVLRRLDCVLADTKDKVLAKAESLKERDVKNLDAYLNRVTGVPFHNRSKLDFQRLLGDPGHIKANLLSYVKGFSEDARDIMERFRFTEQVEKLDGANLLFLVVQRFAEVDLHPRSVPNHMMGSVFEELIRRFAESSNETAGEHFTPREVIRLMVDLLFTEDAKVLTKPGVVKTIYDPACGTGGMLSVAEEYLRELNPQAQLEVFGQELNDESFAICKSDMMIKGQNPENIARGNSFSEPGHSDHRFDYMLSNPPFGVEWKKVEQKIRDEHEKSGFAGRFGAGLPRISDGSLLFLQHMIAKMKPVDPRTGEGGTRIAIVFNGSPLFTGDAGSGESEIRRWIIENDWLEAIVALPEQLFYNTGISTYVWLVTNHKPMHRKGKIQLINAVELYQKMRKSLGDKRHELSKAHIAQIAQTFLEFQPGELSKIFDNEDFGYRRIVVERPLRLSFRATPERLARVEEETDLVSLAKPRKKGAASERGALDGVALQQKLMAALRQLDPAKVWKNRSAFEKDLASHLDAAGLDLPSFAFKVILSALGERDASAEVCLDAKGKPESDADLRDSENVPLKEDVQAYFDREVTPHIPDAWIDESKTKIGYEIPFTRHFYKYQPLRPLEVIEREIREIENQVAADLRKVFE